MDPDLDRLRFLLAALRERSPSPEAEQEALATFRRELGRKTKRPEERGQPGPQGRA
jgi:hypothetical protein